jgi:predicted benzoate:H+ symporter BenE
MTLGTLYLVVAAALIFGACVFAARKVLPHMHARQFAGLAILALLTVALIWTLLSMATRRREEVPLGPSTQPRPLLQPTPD